MGDRAVYCARLESVCAERHPGFESPPIRQRILFCLTSYIMRLIASALFAFVILGLSHARAEETQLHHAAAVEAAKRHFAAGNFDDALAQLNKIGPAEKQNSDALDLRGMIYRQQDKLEEAKKAFQAATESDPSRIAPRLHLGDLLVREKKFADARDIYEKLLRETTFQIPSEKLRYGIFLSYLLAEDEANARRALERIKFPTESPAYYYAQAAWEFAHKKEGEARRWIQAARRIFDPEASAWFAQPLYDAGWIKEKPPPLGAL